MSSTSSRKTTLRNQSSTVAPVGRFAPTSWTAILHASRGDPEKARQALAQLCETYWAPLHAYVRGVGCPEQDAKDLTQEFFRELLEKNLFGAADRTKGRFRNFLLTALKHFLADERRKTGAAKRGGGQAPLSLDETDDDGRPLHEPASGLSPSQAYERRWALTVFQQAFARLRQEHQSARKGALFARLQEFLEGTGQGDYGPAAAELKMTPNAVGVAVHRMRHRFAELVREEIARTLANPDEDEIEIERRHLFDVLSQ
jgi:RNA polymerase sigma-70 factor (ECF subfamily)